MSITRRICTFLLVLAVRCPAISAQDDTIRLSTILINDSSSEESITPLRHFQNTGDDPSLATLFDWLETLQVGAVCALQIEISSTPIQLNESAFGSNRSVSAPVGRAPPA